MPCRRNQPRRTPLDLPLGEGFDLNAGFIERRYVSCDEDDEDAEEKTKGKPNTPSFTDDQCWRSYNATMTLNGGATELIPVDADATRYRARSENGYLIERADGESNGTKAGEYWKVTGTDGSQYFFGRNNLPGQASDTDSAWTVPVYGNHPKEPCHAKEFKDSQCQQAWRWNLDYVVDTHGNTMSLWYEKDRNKYATRATSTATLPYDRAGALKRIDYGTWDRRDKDGKVDRSVAAAAQVQFTMDDRCTSACTKHDDEHWPDTPWDRECKADAKDCQQRFAPTFWSTKRLQKVTTRVWDSTKKTPGWADVESWEFTHTFPRSGDGTHRGMWLDSIKHRGLVGSGVAVPTVTFDPIPKPNRVLTDHNTTLNWQRLSKITTEAGGQIHVTYSDPQCTDDNHPASPADNEMLCYPVIASDPAKPVEMRTEWWHKYVVTSITENDVQLADGQQAQPKNTTYVYEGKPAWHYADDDGLVKPKYKTWSQWRGYGSVVTKVGDSSRTTRTRTTYFRGMHGDRSSSGGTRPPITVDATVGDEKVYDEDQFAGMAREVTVYNGGDDKPITKTVNVPWRSGPTATRTINKDVAEARFVNVQTTYAATALGANGERGWRTTKVHTTFDDDHGTVATTDDAGDIDKTGDEQCVTTTYNRNTAKNIVTLAKLVTTTALPCGQAPSSPDHILGASQSTYDDATSPNTPPTAGSVTLAEGLKNWTTKDGYTFESLADTDHDAFGRPISIIDQRRNKTTTAYSPTGRGPVTKTVVTNPMTWTTTTEFAPYWNLPTKVTDHNKRVSETAYDPLGRVTAQWDAKWTSAEHPDKPSIRYTYCYQPEPNNAPECNSTKKTGYTYIKTETLHAGGGYNTRYDLFDGFLRPRQAQISTPNPGERLVTDTLYDKWGRIERQYGAHAETGDPSGIMFWKPQWAHHTVTQTQYDRASRPINTILLATDGVENLVERWRARTDYAGDATTVTPPAGGTPTTAITDAAGHTVEVRQYTSPQGLAGPFRVTTYKYNGKGQLGKVVDPQNNVWSYTYDIKGRPETVTDPDRGTTTNHYNQVGDLETVLDNHGDVLAYEYDRLGRKIGLYDTVVAKDKVRATWTYDRLASGAPLKGRITASTRFDDKRQEYTVQVADVNERYQPLAVDYKLPASAGFGSSWRLEYGYSDYDGSPTTVLLPGVGGMPQETLTTRYDGYSGLPIGLDTLSDDATYVAKQEYSSYGEPTKTVRKTSDGQRWEEQFAYDLTTRRLATARVTNGTLTTVVANRNYSYDDAGNVTAISDTPTTGQSDTQCFRYDALRQLTDAWTPKTTTTATTRGNADCTAGPALADLSGPAAYRTKWSLDAIGNRTEQVTQTKAGETKQTYTVAPSGEKSVRPHAVTSITTTEPGGLSSTRSFDYDDNGNMKRRPIASGADQKLTWDLEGRLATVLDGTTTHTNLYDGDGNRLIRTDGASATLFLPNMEIRRSATGLSGIRSYSFAGRTIATRNSTDRRLVWTFDDHQGTQQLTIDATSQRTAVRRQDPYGVPRGDNPRMWATNQGFLGGDVDPTGLTRLGARDYDPALGRFLSVDPVHDLADPQQWNPYAYANNTPVTMSDPTGLYGSWCATALCAQQTSNVSGCPECTNNTGTGGDSGGGSRGGGGGTNGHSSGGDDYQGIHKNIVINSHNKNVNKYKQYWDDYLKREGGPGSDDPRVQAVWALKGFAAECASHGPDECAVDTEFMNSIAQQIIDGRKLENFIVVISDDPIADPYNPSRNLDAVLYLPVEGPGAETLTAADSAGLVTAVDNAIRGSRCFRSFDGDTQVLMANRSTKSIKDVEIRDLVHAEDPETGDVGPRAVTAEWSHPDDMYQLETTAGAIITTADHEFWNATERRWEEAGELDEGDRLRTPQGVAPEVRRLIDIPRQGMAYTLTVGGLSTYYVLAGDTPVLVHNCGGSVTGHPSACQCATGGTPKVRNGKLAGGVHSRSGVPFDDHGFPDFSAFMHPEVGEVYIELTGNRNKDFDAANKAAGLKGTPSGYTWHHHQEPGRMQLIDRDVHAKTGHTGGFSVGRR